jgi:Phosphopantetheine attachment site
MPTRSPVPAADPDSPTAGDMLSLVREAWTAALKHTDFSDDDDFFVVGGHSLLAGRVMALLAKQTGQRLLLRMFFDNPTVSELAAAVSAHIAAQPRRNRA